MKWKDKGEMIRLGNIKDNSSQDMKNYQEFVLKHLSSFDAQSVDMFINNIELIRAKLDKEREFYLKVLDKFTTPEIETEINELGSIRVIIRVDLFKILLKGE